MSARDRALKSTVANVLVVQNGMVGAKSLNGESNAMCAIKPGTLKQAKRLKARAHKTSGMTWSERARRQRYPG